MFDPLKVSFTAEEVSGMKGITDMVVICRALDGTAQVRYLAKEITSESVANVGALFANLFDEAEAESEALRLRAG